MTCLCRYNKMTGSRLDLWCPVHDEAVDTTVLDDTCQYDLETGLRLAEIDCPLLDAAADVVAAKTDCNLPAHMTFVEEEGQP